MVTERACSPSRLRVPSVWQTRLIYAETPRSANSSVLSSAIRPLTCGAAGIDHNINPAWNEWPGQPQDLANASSNPVPANGHANFSRRRQPHAAVVESIGEQKDNKGARIPSRAPLVYGLEFSGVLELEKPRGLLSSAQPKRACVPCHAELSRPTGLLATSYARENHASWHDACC